MGLFDNEANRQSGDWLPKVETCPNRLKPCGNPFCADEAMRANNIRAGKNNPLQANHAAEHAQKIASQCKAPVCPLEVATGQKKHKILSVLSGNG